MYALPVRGAASASTPHLSHLSSSSPGPHVHPLVPSSNSSGVLGGGPNFFASSSSHRAAALPKVGVVAVPDAEPMAVPSRLPVQQQAAAGGVGGSSRRVVSLTRRPPAPQLQLQQPQQPQEQLSAIQQATRQQQQELWQAQQVPARGRQQQQQQWQPQEQWQQQQQDYAAAPQAGSSSSPYGGRHIQQQQQQQPRAFQQSWPSSDRSYGKQQQYQQREQRQSFRQGSQAPYQQQQQQQQRGPSQARPQQQQQQYGYNNQQQQQRFKQQDRQQWEQSSNTTGSSSLTAAADDKATRSQLRFSHGLKQDWASLPTGMAVTYLGSSSGAPTRDRNVSCTVLRLPEALYLVDCGEGSSRQAKLTGLPVEQVDALFITHLHGDHCFGIGTMLVSMCRARKAAAAAAAGAEGAPSSSSNVVAGPDSPDALRVFGPPRVGELVSSMLFIAGVGRQLDQPLYITEFVESQLEAHDWEPLPVPASVASSGAAACCTAFIRRMAPTQQLQARDWPPGLSSRLDRTGLHWKSNKRGFTNWEAKPGLLWHIPCRQALVTAAQLQHRVPCWGYVFDELLQPSLPTAATASGSSSEAQQQLGRRVVLLGDTVDSRPIAPVAAGADLVSHEATFAAGMEAKAAMAQHSTAWMAGQFAWAIQAKALVLTHFSARYEGTGRLDRTGNGAVRGGGSRAAASGAAVDEREAEERTVKALQREADDQYGLGPILLAVDLLTAHVPTRDDQQQDDAVDAGAEL